MFADATLESCDTVLFEFRTRQGDDDLHAIAIHVVHAFESRMRMEAGQSPFVHYVDKRNIRLHVDDESGVVRFRCRLQKIEVAFRCICENDSVTQQHGMLSSDAIREFESMNI